jgi:hypothetical protein
MGLASRIRDPEKPSGFRIQGSKRLRIRNTASNYVFRRFWPAMMATGVRIILLAYRYRVERLGDMNDVVSTGTF